MKNNNVKKIAGRTKLFSAIGMFTVSAVMLASSTYAWFTMNKDVKVTGMEMRTKVGANLLICQTNVEGDYKSGQLSQSRSVLLEPVSTVSGATGSYFYTLDAAADGQKIATPSATPYVAYNEAGGTTITGADKINNDGYSSSGAAKAKVDGAFNTAYGITAAADAAANTNAYGYVDYDFYLKATNDQASQALNLTWCNLLYNAGGNGTDTALGSTNDAWRIAIFAKDITANGGDGNLYTTDITTATAPATVSENLITILTPDGAEYFTTGNKAVSVANAAPSVAVSKLNTSAVLDTFSTTTGETRYYKVTVRVWLEGEDTTCFSSNYSTVDVLYKLDLGLELGKGTAVTGIGSSTSAWVPAT